MAAQQSSSIPGVKHLIAVASGKGGVGKSTTSVNLALALSLQGKKVGLLDADIYGPSIPTMLGVPEGTRPQVSEGNRLIPIEAHGLQTISMGNLTTEDTPVVWRGPMASGALVQILTETLWHDIDVLVVDLPPGTGDIQLTLAQKAPVSGALIVTTPQDIALKDAVKAIEMFSKVSIPLLGIVENMSVHVCTSCGHEEHLFGQGGAQMMAEKYGVEMIGSLPLVGSIREDLDDGIPTLVKSPDGDIAERYKAIAKKVWDRLEGSELTQKGPEIVIE
jgi:ATP-binding protein involved in chromosome partitioning